MATALAVAETILDQLGRNRFIAMTGAHDFLGGADSLQFRLPARFAKRGINRVRIVLDPTDTYTVQFWRGTNARNIKLVEEHSDIYADELRAVFTQATGLDTHL